MKVTLIQTYVMTDSSNQGDYSQEEINIQKISHFDLKSDLIAWASSYNVSCSAINSLLGILRKHGNGDVPLNYRTLFSVDYSIKNKDMGEGTYFYCGIQHGVERILQSNICPVDMQEFSLIVNVDGLPISHS